MIDREFTVGDLLVSLYAVLKDGNGVPVDLAGQTVVFTMENAFTGTNKVNAQAAVVVQNGAENVGHVRYDWTEADVDTEGVYWGYFIRTKNGKPATHPVGKQLRIVFLEKP